MEILLMTLSWRVMLIADLNPVAVLSSNPLIFTWDKSHAFQEFANFIESHKAAALTLGEGLGVFVAVLGCWPRQNDTASPELRALILLEEPELAELRAVAAPAVSLDL